MSFDHIAALKRTPLFHSLGEKELQAIATCTVERKLSAGEVLFSAGDPGTGLYIIVAGTVRAVRESTDGREQVIHVEHAGTTFAEVPVFDDGPFPSTVIADEPSQLLFIDKYDMRHISMEYPQIALSALALLAKRLRRCTELVESLSLHPVTERLATWLIEQSKIKGQPSAEGIYLNLTLTNQQIAARIGTVREIVSRVFNQLQQESLIIVQGRRVLIPNLAKLINYVEKYQP